MRSRTVSSRGISGSIQGSKQCDRSKVLLNHKKEPIKISFPSDDDENGKDRLFNESYWIYLPNGWKIAQRFLRNAKERARFYKMHQSFVALILTIFLLLTLLIFTITKSNARQHKVFPLEILMDDTNNFPPLAIPRVVLDFPVLVPSVVKYPAVFHYPQRLNESLLSEGTVPEYEINLIFPKENFRRVIHHDTWEGGGEARDYSTRDDDIQSYYAFDDDFVRDVAKSYNQHEYGGKGVCRRVPWHRLHYPNCNLFHEMNNAINIPSYIGLGSYRDVMLHEHHFLNFSETLVWKQALWSFRFVYVSVMNLYL
jgi:hypothetical protein